MGRIHELLAHHPAEQKATWSAATPSFAVLQAVAAYGMSLLFVCGGGDYRLLFLLGTAAMVLALATDLVAAVGSDRRRRGGGAAPNASR